MMMMMMMCLVCQASGVYLSHRWLYVVYCKAYTIRIADSKAEISAQRSAKSVEVCAVFLSPSR